MATTNRAHLFRGFFLMTAFALAQHLVVAPAMADATQCPCSFWSTAVNTGDESIDTNAVNLGIKFQSDTAGYIKAIRFYKFPDNTATVTNPHIGYLWDANGNQLSSATFDATTETASGWQQVSLPSPVQIAANTTYVASYYAPNSHWAHDVNYFNTFGVDSPPLHIAAGGGNNGVFAYGSAGLFPATFEAAHASNYFVDVVFDTTNVATTTAPTASLTPANAATGVDPNGNITINFNRQVDANTVSSTTLQLLDGLNPVATTVTYPGVASTPTATIIPSPILTLSHQYTVIIKGGASGVKDVFGNALASDVTTTFTTAATMPNYNCPCTLWTPTTVGGTESADVVTSLGGVNLGVKFQSDATGYIKGIRFYKWPDNTGTHSAYLWNSAGTLLASATFTGETASGWQEVRFATPVAITRHTTYIAAYYTPVGHWANTRPFFQVGPFVTLPLRALQNFNQATTNQSPNSIFVYGAAGGFPTTDPLDAPTYYVDPVFDTTPAPIITSTNATTFTAGTAGSFTVVASGPPSVTITESGTLPAGVTFLDHGDGTAAISGTPAGGTGGVYPLTFTATNSFGTSSQNFTLTVNEAPSITSAAVNQTACNNSNATFSAAASGFPAPTLQWQVSSDGGTTFTNISGATSSPFTTPATTASNGFQYRAHFTNPAGSADTTASLTVTTPPAPTITAGGPTTFCDGGSVLLTSSIGTAYQWFLNGTAISAATSQTYSATATGDYTVQATIGGCPSVSAATHVTVNPIPATPTASNGGPYCEGATIQFSTPTVAGATYTWTDPNGFMTHTQNPTIANATVAMSGVYTVTVTVNGCTSAAGSTTLVVNAKPAIPTVTASGATTFCQGGSVTLTASLATSYLWSTGEITQSISVSASGSYSVTVTNASGCRATSAATTVTVNPAPVTPTITPSGPTTFCQGGSVTLTASAATSYLWSNGATTQAINVTASGSYSVTVTNANNCSATSAATTVTVNPLPTPTITPSGPTTFCQGGSVTLTASAATSYLWSNGATTQAINVTASGSYSVTVTNANNCSATSAATTVTVNPLPTATITAGGPTTFCQGGSVTLTASSGSSYLWSNGATTQSINVTSSGNYSVTVTGANGCSATSTPTTVSVNPLPAATITASGATTFCQGGSVTLTASLGSSYLWSNGATTQAINVTASGSYSVTVRNANGCSATSSSTAVVVNPTPATPTISAGGPTTFCQGGSVTLTSSLAASYLWSTGETTQSISVSTSGSYSVTIQDGNGCSSATSAATTVVVTPTPSKPTISAGGAPTTFCQGGSVTFTSSSATGNQWFLNGSPISGAINSTYSATSSGDYTVQVTTSGCPSPLSDATTVTVNALPAATITAGGPTTFCQGGSVTLTASAGSSYLWSNGATTPSINVTSSGSYSVTVTGANGCSATSAATTVTVNPLPTATITAGGPTTFCQGGSVTLTASSGTSYLWSNGATTPSINVTSSGSYTVTVSNGTCSATSAATTVTVNPLPTATITAGGPTTFCQGGSVTLTASSGTSYLWSNGATTPSINVTSSGSYTVTVSNGTCSATSAATTVTVNPLPTATITAGGPTTFCQGGSVTLTASSGTSYLWSNGATTPSINVTSSGSYSVTVSNGTCSATSAATTVTVNPLPTAPITAPTGVTTSSTGNTASGPAGMSTYAWSITNGTITSATNTPSITFTAGTTGTMTLSLTVTNAGACSASNSVSIDVYAVSVSGNVASGGTLTSDTGGTGATPSNPLQASVTLPSGVSGAVSISTGVLQPGDSAPSGYTYYNNEVDITAPAQTAANPLVFVFLIDPSILPAGQNQNTVQLFRNGVVVPNCNAGAGTSASPDPCIAVRGLNGTDISLTVRTSAASRWNCARSLANTAPTAVNDAYSTNQNTTLTVNAPGVLSNDTDPDLNTLTAVSASTPGHGTVVLNSNGSFTYTPAAGYSGSDSFTYYANDGTVNSALPATVAITVIASSPPVISVDSPSLQPPAKGTTAPMNFHITLSSASSQTVTVHYVTSNSTAIAGTDYVATSGTATFPAGTMTTSVTVGVPIIGTATNTQKAFFMSLDSPTNATVQTVNGFPVKGRGTILAK